MNQGKDLLERKPLVDEYLQKTPRGLSSFSFVNIFIWQGHFDFRFEKKGDNLCVFAENDLGVFLYLPPLGRDISGEAIVSCFADMRRRNKGSGVSRIENVAEGQSPHFPEARFEHYRKGYEYCYCRRDLVGLKGRDLKSKRNAYNHFVKNYAGHYLPYETAMAAECVVLYDRWVESKRLSGADEIYAQMLEDNRGVHRLTLDYFKELDLVGRVVVVDGRIAAYTFGYFLNDEMFCVLHEIADLDCKGLAGFIFREFCADPELRGVKFINVMDDFAMDKVAQTKLSYRPALLLPVYVITERND